jgi:hypothetical protein
VLLGIFGGLTVIMGVHHVVTRRVDETGGEYGQLHRTYTGFAAVMDGVGTVLIGLFMLMLSVVLMLDSGDAVIA